MTQPLLDYHGTAGPNKLRGATWIYLLTLGILYSMGTLCVGTSAAVTVFGDTASRSQLNMQIVMFVMTTLVCVGTGTAISYIWSAILIKRRSRKAAVVALIVALFNVAVIVAILASVMIVVIRTGERNTIAMIVGTLFYLIVAALNSVAAWLLFRFLRETRSEAPV